MSNQRQISKKKRPFALLLGVVLATMAASVAANDMEMRVELERLKARIDQLEQQLQAQPQKQVKQDQSWTSRIGFSGLVEVEASYQDGPGASTSDTQLAKVEIGLDARVNDWVSASLLLLFEEDNTDPIDFDEAIITIGNTEVSPFYLAAGRIHLPFGRFETQMVSDPITLDMTEFIETAVQVGAVLNGWEASVFVFNGEIQERGDDRLDQFGASLNYAWASEDGGRALDAGLYYVNNIADSDGLQEAVADAAFLSDQIPGVGGHLILSAKGVRFIAEYLQATRDFDVADLSFKGAGAQPKSWNIELGYEFMLGEWASQIAFAWQGTDEALALELPERRLMGTWRVGILENTALSLEWAHDADYGRAEGGSGDNTDSVIAQIQVVF